MDQYFVGLASSDVYLKKQREEFASKRASKSDQKHQKKKKRRGGKNASEESEEEVGPAPSVNTVFEVPEVKINFDCCLLNWDVLYA